MPVENGLTISDGSVVASRKATWFELYFDLAFVLCVAALTQRHVEEYTVAGAAKFALQFLIVWSLWVGHTFWASRYDQDRIDQHLLGFIKILVVLAIAYGAMMQAGVGLWFGLGVGVFKLLLAFAYLRDSGRHDEAMSGRAAAGIFGLQGAAWAATMLLPDAYRLLVWSALLLVELASPYLLDKVSHRPPHPEHMPERFGLFTIILLGEAVASALHGLAHSDHVSTHTVVTSLCGAALSFLFWVGYFHRARSASARQTEQFTNAREVRRWVYAHMPFYLGIAGFSAGTIAIASHAQVGSETAWLQACAVAVAMTGLTLVGLASPNNLFQVRWVWPHGLLAILTIPAAFLASPFGATVLMLTLVALTLMQLLFALWTSRRVGASICRAKL